jgi:hypothetical protein
MINFPILYTGKGTTQPLKEMGDSFEQFSQKYIETQKIKLDKSLKDEKWFLDQQLDPVQLMADAATEKQAKYIEWMNEKYAKKMEENEGMLPMQEKLNLAADKRRGIAMQQQMQADQKRAMTEYQVISRDFKGEYEHDKFWSAWREFLETGKYPPTSLEPAAKDFIGHLRKEGNQYRSSTNQYISEVEGRTISSTEEVRGTLRDAQQKIQFDLRNDNGSFLKTVVADFDSLDYKEKEKWLNDANNDGVIDDAEMLQDRNGIINWAMNNPKYIEAFRGGDVKTVNKPKTSGGGFSILWGNTKKTIYPARPISRTVGGKYYDDYYPFLNLGTVSVPLGKVTEIDGEDRSEGDVMGNTKVKVAGFVPSTGEFFFELEEGRYTKGNTVAVDINQLNDQYQKEELPADLFELPVMYNGKMVQIKDILNEVGGGQQSGGKVDVGGVFKQER